MIKGVPAVDFGACQQTYSTETQGSRSPGTLATPRLCAPLANDATVLTTCGIHQVCLAQSCRLVIMRLPR